MAKTVRIKVQTRVRSNGNGSCTIRTTKSVGNRTTTTTRTVRPR